MPRSRRGPVARDRAYFEDFQATGTPRARRMPILTEGLRHTGARGLELTVAGRQLAGGDGPKTGRTPLDGR